MADIAITAANVVKVSNTNVLNGIAGATITAGQCVYLDSTTNTYKLAKGDAALTAGLAGVALNGASANQPLQVITSGTYNGGGTFVVGKTYVMAADTAGAIAPESDLTTGNYVSVLGVAVTANNIQLAITATGIAHA